VKKWRQRRKLQKRRLTRKRLKRAANLHAGVAETKRKQKGDRLLFFKTELAISYSVSKNA